MFKVTYHFSTILIFHFGFFSLQPLLISKRQSLYSLSSTYSSPDLIRQYVGGSVRPSIVASVPKRDRRGGGGEDVDFLILF